MGIFLNTYFLIYLLYFKNIYRSFCMLILTSGIYNSLLDFELSDDGNIF